VSEAELQVVFVSGLSGSGKTTAMAALEDLGFYCVDNLPAQLTGQFLDLCVHATPPIAKVALALDPRETRFFEGIPAVVEELRASGSDVHVVFLECTDEILVNRYRETRRVHPLSPDGSVEAGIRLERERLEEVAGLADLRIDTTQLNVHQLRETVTRKITGGRQATVVNLVSFGFRYGLPRAADLVFDVRFLRNPHFEPELRLRTGLEADVAAYVFADERSEALVGRLEGLLAFLLPLYDDEGKAYLTVAVGCTGGRHRSVAVLAELAKRIEAAGREVSVEHRDVEKAT
jgi:UPF0042 nucleotide-binding protein